MKITKLIKQDVEESYARLQSLQKVAEEFNCTKENIRYFMHKENLHINKRKVYICDHDFFSHDNEESFYIAGFLEADGCIKERKQIPNTVSLDLLDKDEKHLIKIKDILKSDYKIHTAIAKNSLRNPKYKDSIKKGFAITSEQMCKDLLRFGVTPRKTHTYVFPEWLKTHPLVNHFMRGSVDGDGSFWLNKDTVYFNILGTENLVKTFHEILIKECNLPIDSGHIKQRQGCWSLEYGGNLIVGKISNFLYKDATIYLERKYDIAKKSIIALNSKEERNNDKSIKEFRKAANSWFKRPIEPTAENVKNLYKKHGTVRKVAKELKVRLSTASSLIKQYNIEK